jgi:hypothetical protein
VPTSPTPEQVGFELNAGGAAPLVIPNTRFAVSVIWTVPLPLQGGVVDPIAPHRAAVSTEIYNVFSIHTIQAVWIIPKTNQITGKATNPNSRAVVPRLFFRNPTLQNPDSRRV